MKRILTGWGRLGIVLSVLWIIVVSVKFGSWYQDEKRDRDLFIDRINQAEKDFSKSLSTNDRVKFIGRLVDPPKLQIARYNPWPLVEFYALFLVIPIGTGWVAVLSIVWSIRWIRAGFRDSKPN